MATLWDVFLIPMSDPFDEDAELRGLLRTLSPSARERLRDVLIRDQVDRDLIAARLLRFRDRCAGPLGPIS